MKRFPWDLFCAALVYLATRGLVLHTAFDRTAMPMYELFPMGTMAELAREHVDVPLAYFYDNAAGQILFGYVTRPFFALFGPSYLALKLVTLTLGLGVLALVWTFLRASFGARAATIGAFLFALAPTTLFKYSTMNSGNHFENLFFVMLAAVCCYRALRGGERAWLFASGFTAGFALFVFLGALIPIGLFAGLHLGVRGLRRSLRDLALVLPGFALGILPLLLVNAATGARGLGFLEAKFAAADDAPAGGAPLARTVEFLTRHLFDAPVYEPFLGVSGAVLGALFLAAFALAYLASVPQTARGVRALLRGLARPADDVEGRRERFEGARLVPLVLYLPLAALAYGISNFRIGGHGPPIVVAGYRYFLPHLLFALLLVAVVASRWIERGGVARVAGTLLAAIPLACGLSNLAIADWSFAKTGIGARYMGYNLAQVGRALVAGRNELSHERIVEHLASFPPLVRRRVATSIGFNLGTLAIEDAQERARASGAPSEWTIDARKLVAGWPEEHAIDLARGQGVALRFTGGGGAAGIATIERVLARALADDARLGALVAEGACLPPGTEPLESRTAALLGTNAALVDAAAPELREHVLRGAGLFVGRLLVRDMPSERAPLDEWMRAHADDDSFWIGVGQGLADGGETPRSPATIAIAREASARACRMGFGLALARARGATDAAMEARRSFGERASEAEPDIAAGMRWTSYPAR